MHPTIDQAKAAARALRERLTDRLDLTHSQALEIVAGQLGYRDWNTARAGLSHGDPQFGPAVPVLRMMDEASARAFYLDYLGFSVEWEHRYEPGMPLYMRIRRSDLTLDLSEHHGDGTPGTVLWIPVSDIDRLHTELTAREHPRLRPGIERDAPGGPTMEIVDPSGNVLRFCRPAD